MLNRKNAVGGAALLAHRNPPDIFTAASKGAARRLRDAAIPDAAEFDAHPHLCIELRWGVKVRRQVRSGGEWVDLRHMPDGDE